MQILKLRFARKAALCAITQNKTPLRNTCTYTVLLT